MPASSSLRKRPRSHWIFPTLTALAVIVMVARIGLTWRVFNDTVDEPYHIGAGIGLLEARKHIEGTQHPPLARMIAAIPLYLSGVRYPQDRGLKTVQWDLHAFDVGHHVLLHSILPYWSVLIRARAAMLIFPILSVLYLYWLGKYLAGPMVGCLAAVAFSTDPNLLAHGALVTTDVAAVAGFLAATYYGIRFIAHPTRARAAVAGVAMGLALSCKFSCAIAGIGLLIILLLRRARVLRGWNWRVYFRAWPTVAQFAIAALCMFLSLWATYFFNVGRLDQAVAIDRTLEWQGIPPALRHIPIPMPSAVLGYLTLAEHNRMGHGSYLNGRIDNTGWWYYFPEAIALKSPVAFVIGIVLAVAVLLMTRRPPRAARAAFIPFALFMLISMSAGINIGIRHILPAIALLYLLVAWQLMRVRMGAVVIAIIAICFVETLALHPDYLAFFNILAGGPRGGDRYLLDSNLDWGQDQARLKTWLEQHARGRVITDDVFGNPRLREWDQDGYHILPHGSPPAGIVAISKNVEHGLYPITFEDAQGRTWVEPDVSWIPQRLRPIAHIGYTIDLYDLEHAEPAEAR